MTRLSDGALARLREAVRQPDLSTTRYELLGVAGSGGMGTVYAALDRALGRRVALKVLDAGGPALEARLTREAQVLARLEHPGIVPVHEVGTLPDGRAYYTMKLVEGESLGEHCARGLPLAERLRLFLRVAEAVAFAHARGVVHRDLKPDNVMVGAFGEVLVLDWGLAKVLAEAAEAAPLAAADGAAGSRAAAPGAALRTGDGAVLGTPGYRAPEQEAGASATVDARADVFSLGKLLAGLSAPESPAPLAAAVARATAHAPEHRYPSAAALAQDVARFLDGEAVSAHRESLWARAARLARRHRTALAILSAYALGRALIYLWLGR